MHSRHIWQPVDKRQQARQDRIIPVSWLRARRPCCILESRNDIVLVAVTGNAAAQWAAAGFTNNSTAIPSQIVDRSGLTETLATFLVNNPGYEVDSLNLTGPYALDLWDAATSTRDGVMTAEQARLRKALSLADASGGPRLCF